MGRVRSKTIAAVAVLAAAALIAGAVAARAGLDERAGVSVYPMAGVVAVLIAVFAYGWPRLLKLPDPWHITWLLLLAGWAATLAATLTALPSPMQWMPLCLGLGVVGVFGSQLVRGTGATRRLESTLAALLGLLATTFASGWVAVLNLAVLGTNPLVVPIGAAVVALLTLVALLILAGRLPRSTYAGSAAMTLAPLLASGTLVYFTQRLLLQ